MMFTKKISLCTVAGTLLLTVCGSSGMAATWQGQDIAVNVSAAETPQDGRPVSRKFRLIWLHAPTEHEVETSLPEDLQPLASELTQLGIGELEVAGQWIINSTGGVDLQSEMDYDGYVYGFEADGLYSEQEGRFYISLSATILPEGGCLTDSRHVANWSTEIYTQAEELTLVGISPTLNGTAVLVMQIMED